MFRIVPAARSSRGDELHYAPTSSRTSRSRASGRRCRARCGDLARELRLGRATRVLAGGAGRREPRGSALVEEVRAEHEDVEIVVSGCVGPRGDAYRPTESMTAAEAEEYHARQIATLSETAADMVSGLTLTYVEEAIGIVRAARAPAADGRLVHRRDRRPPAKRAAAGRGDRAGRQPDRRGAAAYFMVNCAHPTHFADVVADGGRGQTASGVSVSTPRQRATPSSTKPRSSTPETPKSSPPSTRSCVSTCRI